MNKRMWRRILIGLALVVLLSVAATAQEVPPDLFDGGGDTAAMIGFIPGTNMLRDEFRARAMVQLKAIALNALAYRLIHEDEYAESFYTLRNSESWNLDVRNMFTGRPINAIYIDPAEEDMTTRLVLDVPLEINEDERNLGIISLDGGANLESLGEAMQELAPSTAPRIDPESITTYTGGDVIYFVTEDMLQLVMFAPDGTFVEHVDEKPNGGWRKQLATPGGSLWPDTVLAAQLLFFLDRLLPQHYNLAEFMGGRETRPQSQLIKLGATERLGMAAELNITVLNPFTREPAVDGAEFSLGNFLTADAANPLPLRLCLRDKQSWTLDSLHGEATADAPQDQPAPEQPPAEKPARPPLGGRK